MPHRPSQYQRGETAGIEDAALGLRSCSLDALAAQRGENYARGYAAGYGEQAEPSPQPNWQGNRRYRLFRWPGRS